jgi:hypothetical protein
MYFHSWQPLQFAREVGINVNPCGFISEEARSAEIDRVMWPAKPRSDQAQCSSVPAIAAFAA